MSQPGVVTDPVFKAQSEQKLDVKRQTKYFLRCLKTYLPQQYTSNDSNRLSLAFFIVAALDLLGSLESSTTPEERADYIDWVYSNQHPKGGFRAFPGTAFGDKSTPQNECWDPANLPATYFALCTLVVLGDDFGRLQREECLRWLPTLQREDGSFGETRVDGEIHGGIDSRFGYCGAGVRYILRGKDTDFALVRGCPDIDVDKLVQCIRAAETYDGGISDAPFHEAQAGFTFCGLGCLSFLDRLPPREAPNTSSHLTNKHATITGPSDPNAVISWLVSRQTATITEEDEFDTHADETDTPTTCHDTHSFVLPEKFTSDTGKQSHDTRPSRDFALDWTGFNGRCNKIADTCYAFWVEGALEILGHLHLVDIKSPRRCLLEKMAHHALGGFGKHAGDLPDLYHSYLGLAALSLLGEKKLKPLDGTMCISVDAHHRLDGIWKRWSETTSESSR